MPSTTSSLSVPHGFRLFRSWAAEETLRPRLVPASHMGRVSSGLSFLYDKELRLKEDGPVIRYALKGCCCTRGVP